MCGSLYYTESSTGWRIFLGRAEVGIADRAKGHAGMGWWPEDQRAKPQLRGGICVAKRKEASMEGGVRL